MRRIGAHDGGEMVGTESQDTAQMYRRAVGEAVRSATENGRAKRQNHVLTIEQAGAIDPPREYRISPDGRRVAFTAECAGARQLFVMPVKGGYPEQLTASEKSVADPQWSPDGRRIAFTREDSIWMIDVEGSHQVVVTQHTAGNRSPRWCPDGHSIAFLSRRRGWDQLWVVEAPVPRRGRPSTRPRSAEPTPLTRPGVDVEEFAWSPDGRRIAVTSQRSPDLLTSQIHIVDVASGRERLVAGETAWETGPRWLPDGSGLLMISDESGWFQVVRISVDGKERTVLTTGEHEHGEPSGGWGYAPTPSPDGKRFSYIEIRDGLVDLLVADLPDGSATSKRSAVVSASDGVWIQVGWMPDSSGLLAVGRSDRTPDDLWHLPTPEAAAEGVKPRQITHSMPVVVDSGHFAAAKRISFAARDGRTVAGTLYLPANAAGEDAVRVPCVVHSHGGPTHQTFRDWFPFRQLVVDAGMAFFSVDFRGSTGYGKEFRWANRGEWGHADAFDVIDAARWAAGQAWCDGRVAHYGASYGGYMTLCVLAEEPSLWRCGIDLYGDSEIAESYRHGDRPGRIDLERMMGKPDDPAAADLYRRGSPVYRAERIEAPLLILHGRKDRRVAPLMTEKMVEALDIEGKCYQVHWYDEEAHGWNRRENRRDAWKRCLDFLKLHLLEKPEED